MAPAEVDTFIFGRGPGHDKVHAGQKRQFDIEGVQVEVDCTSSFLTSVEVSGKNIYFMIRGNLQSPISSEGDFQKGKLLAQLTKSGESISIRDKKGIHSRIHVKHTFHDGSTGEAE